MAAPDPHCCAQAILELQRTGLSLLQSTGFLEPRRAGLSRCRARVFSSCGARASLVAERGFSGTRASAVLAHRHRSCSSWAPRAQQLWCMGLVAPKHVGSSRTRDRTPASPALQDDSVPLDHQGKSSELFLKCTNHNRHPTQDLEHVHFRSRLA